MSIQWLQRLEAAGVPREQAEAIASMPEERLVDRDYLDAKLQPLASKADLHDAIHALTWRILGIVSLTIVIVGLLDKFVRP